MATIKARLENIYRDLGRAGARWEIAVKVIGSAYSEALDNHMNNLPTQNPPDKSPLLMAKTVAGVVTLAAGTVLAPVTVVIVFTGVAMGIEEIGDKLGQKGKLFRTVPPITPLNYENTFSTYITAYVTDCQDLIDKYIEVIDKIIAPVTSDMPIAEYPLTQEDMYKVEKWIEASPFMYPPLHPKSWNREKALEKEMEKLLWKSWADQHTGKTMVPASIAGDMSRPYNRLAELGAVTKKTSDLSDSGYKVHLSLLITMKKWAGEYKPKQYGSPAPKAASQFALKARGLKNMKKPQTLRLSLEKLKRSLETN